MEDEIDIIIAQLNDIDATGMIKYYIVQAIENLNAAKEEAQDVKPELTTCPDCDTQFVICGGTRLV